MIDKAKNAPQLDLAGGVIRPCGKANLQSNAKNTAPAEAEVVDVEKTVVNDNPKGHTLEEQQNIEAYKAAVDPGIISFYQQVRQGQYDGKPYSVAQVSNQGAQAMENLTGKKVYGNTIMLDDNGVNHIERRHGKNGAADHSMKNLEDVARIKYVLQNFDNVQLSKKKQRDILMHKAKGHHWFFFQKK